MSVEGAPNHPALRVATSLNREKYGINANVYALGLFLCDTNAQKNYSTPIICKQ